MAEFVKVATTGDIPVGGIKKFEIGPDRFIIAHSENGFYAMVNECTHESVPLDKGRIRGNDILCTAHGAKFDLKTGAVTAPPAVVPLEILEVKIENDEIFVLLDD